MVLTIKSEILLIFDSMAKSYGRYNSNTSQPIETTRKAIQLVEINLPIKDHIRK